MRWYSVLHGHRGLAVSAARLQIRCNWNSYERIFDSANRLWLTAQSQLFHLSSKTSPKLCTMHNLQSSWTRSLPLNMLNKHSQLLQEKIYPCFCQRVCSLKRSPGASAQAVCRSVPSEAPKLLLHDYLTVSGKQSPSPSCGEQVRKLAVSVFHWFFQVRAKMSSWTRGKLEGSHISLRCFLPAVSLLWAAGQGSMNSNTPFVVIIPFLLRPKK